MTTLSSTATVVAVAAPVLKAAMAKLKPALGHRGARVLSCVRIDSDGTDITLTATDLDVTLTTVVTGIVSAPGLMLVPAAVINKMISVRPKGTIEIAVSAGDGEVKSGNATLGFDVTPVVEFPVSPPPVGRAVTLNLDVVAELASAVSGDGSRPILCSMLVEDGSYVATDSYRLHIVNTAAKTGATFLLPRPAVEVATKYKGVVACRVDVRHITVVLDETTTMTARLLEGEFVPYRALVPSNPPQRLTYTDEFIADLKAVVKLSSGDRSEPVRIREVDGELELRIGGGDRKPAKVTTPGAFTLGAALAFNPHYLLAVLQGTKSNVILAIDTLKPVVVREPAPEYGATAERVRLIMPVRVN